MAAEAAWRGAGMDSDDETSGGTQRRRMDAERQTIVTEAFAAGQSVSVVADRYGVSTASIYLWRRQSREAGGAAREARGVSHPPSPVTLVPVRIASAPEVPVTRPPPRDERIAIRLANGRIIEVGAGIDPMQLVRLVAALESAGPIEGGP